MIYNKEEIQKAKSVDLVKLLQSMNIELRKENNAYRVVDYQGGLYVFEKNNNLTSGFYYHKENLKGNAIDFCKKIFNETYVDAIKRLLDFEKKHSIESASVMYPKKKTIETKKEFVMPGRDKDIKQAYSYLIKTRKINKGLVDKCIKYGIIRQFREGQHVYVGFIGKDKNNKEQYLMLRSTLTNSSFKKEYLNSNKCYGFKIFNKESVETQKTNIFIFESAIDLLSYMTLNRDKTLSDNVFISMGGVSSLALNKFVEEYNPNINSINICFDNDKTGIDKSEKLKSEISDKYKDVTINIFKPVYKDYNEQLKIMSNSQNMSDIDVEKSVQKI